MNNEHSTENILPYDGIARYDGKLFEPQSAHELLARLLNNILWQHDELVMFGKKITTKRKMAWYGYHPFEYTYSKVTKKAHLWTDDLLQIKNKVEAHTGEKFNACLLNLYHDGNEGMSWHADNEKELLKHGAIASISFGAERKFVFKHRTTKEKVELVLESGSVLVMKGEIQEHWLHALPIQKKCKALRINLTFRTINIL